MNKKFFAIFLLVACVSLVSVQIECMDGGEEKHIETNISDKKKGFSAVAQSELTKKDIAASVFLAGTGAAALSRYAVLSKVVSASTYVLSAAAKLPMVTPVINTGASIFSAYSAPIFVGVIVLKTITDCIQSNKVQRQFAKSDKNPRLFFVQFGLHFIKNLLLPYTATASLLSGMHNYMVK